MFFISVADVDVTTVDEPALATSMHPQTGLFQSSLPIWREERGRNSKWLPSESMSVI